MYRSRKLIEAYRGGQSARDLIAQVDAISPATLAHDIRHALISRGVKADVQASKLNENYITINLHSHSHLAEGIVELFERAYPEFDMLINVKRSTEGA